MGRNLLRTILRCPDRTEASPILALDCKYHVVFVPTYRRSVLFRKVRQYLGPIFHELARHKECQIIEGQIMPDHVHMLIAVPPQYAVASVIGFIKGKSANAIARQ